MYPLNNVYGFAHSSTPIDERLWPQRGRPWLLPSRRSSHWHVATNLAVPSLIDFLNSTGIVFGQTTCAQWTATTPARGVRMIISRIFACGHRRFVRDECPCWPSERVNRSTACSTPPSLSIYIAFDLCEARRKSGAHGCLGRRRIAE